MGIKTDIEILCSLVIRHTEHGKLAERVEDWLESPSCPLVEENEAELYNGDGNWGICKSCGANGFWYNLVEQNPSDSESFIQQHTIICECGHEEVLL